jgi:hypothetical protein
MFSRTLALIVAIGCFGLAAVATDSHRIEPHTRLCYDAGGGTNIWFYSYMRCRMKPEEDYTFHRYRFVPKSGRVYYENGGVLQVFKDKMTYLGVTNFFSCADSFLLTPTTNRPHGCIWLCK